MTTDHPDRQTIIGRIGLLGASAGVILGLIEAACLRLPNWPLPLLKPHVPFSFWFFAPLLMSVVFGLLGLLAGFLASRGKSRLLGMLLIGALVGLAGDYFWLVLKSYSSAWAWVIFLQDIITPSLIFALILGCTLAYLWATRRPGIPLGVLADVPILPWSRAVLSSMAVLAIATGLSYFPDHLLTSTAHATDKSQQPNIVLIVWDTTRADHLSSYGYARNTTPNVDQLAQRGVLFENAVSASNWTLPGMASVFTSLLPHQHGAGVDTPLGNGPKTLAEILQDGGYETAGFNANSTYGATPWGLARGFETYLDCTSTLGYSLHASRMGHDIIEPSTEKWLPPSRISEFNAHQLNEQVYHWFDHRSDRPFFLFLNYDDAHDPYDVPAPYDRTYGRVSKEALHRLEAEKFGHFDLSADERESLIIGYDNALHYIDSQMGELLRFLERSPDWSNTYVIITADHGEAFGEHHNYTHGRDLHREVLHVPLVVAGPGIPAGVRISHTGATRQIFSTVLKWAGMDQAVLRKTSLSRMWNADYRPINPDEARVSEVIDATAPPAPQGMITLTTREWQFIYQAGKPRYQLYHWPTDPMEQQDVADLPENQALIEHLKASLLAIIEKSYRPWRDTSYLLALSGPDFSPDLEAGKSVPLLPEGPLLPQGPGAAQTLFPPNPETPSSNDKNADKELLKSLPYDAP
jgi:arylsulfatase A-like enzyme